MMLGCVMQPELPAPFSHPGHGLQVLSDDNKKAVYDRYGEAGLKGGMGGFGGGGMGGQGDFSNPFDLFESFFGGQAGFGGGAGGFGARQQRTRAQPGEDER